jgi:Pregnancy-associated plasma protein-A
MCNLEASRDLWGYSTFPEWLADIPEFDGVVIFNPWPSKASVLDVYMTLVHEVGHWMGLYHTFEGACDPYSGGDAIAGTYSMLPTVLWLVGISHEHFLSTDTPAHSGPSQDEYGADSCFAGLKLDTCPNNVVVSVVYFWVKGN